MLNGKNPKKKLSFAAFVIIAIRYRRMLNPKGKGIRYKRKLIRKVKTKGNPLIKETPTPPLLSSCRLIESSCI